MYLSDLKGNLIQTMSPDGTFGRSVYDELGRVIWQSDRATSSTSDVIGTFTTYDSLGRVVKTERYDQVAIGIANITVGGVSVPSATLTSHGSLRSTGGTWYDDQGRAIEREGAGGLRTATIYDAQGRVHYSGDLKSTVADGGTPGVDANGNQTIGFGLSDLQNVTAYAYDAITSSETFDTVTDANHHTTTSYKDFTGRATRTVFDDGSFTQTLYSNGDQAVAAPEDNFAPTIPAGGSEVISIAQRKPNGATLSTIRVYDKAGQLVEVYEPAVDDATTASTALVRPHTHYAYDNAGNEITQTDAENRTTTFKYDELGNRVGRTLPDGESESTTYDDLNRELTHTDFSGNVATYAYYAGNTGDATAGQLHTVTYTGAAGSGKATQVVTYTYDDLGRQQTITDASGTTTDSYDDQGNLIEEQTPEGDIHYVFDPATGHHTETYTLSSDIAYGYDQYDRLSSVTVTKLSGTALTGSAQLVTNYTYDSVGDKLTETLPNGIVTTYSYDDLNRLTDVNETKGTTSLFSQHYVLNGDGTRASSHEVQLQSDNTTSLTIDTTWTYDADDRLIGESLSSSDATRNYTDTFAFDLVGNRITKSHDVSGTANDETTTYTYNGDDQLQTETSSLSTVGTTTYTYDDNGSQHSATNTTTSRADTFAYDVRNKMTGSTVNGVESHIVYDDAGNRVRESVGTGSGKVTTYYLTDTQNPTGYVQPLEEWNGTGSSPTLATATLAKTYLIGDRIFGQNNGTATSYLTSDGHGSTQQLSNSTGTITQAFQYDAFGGAVGFALNTAGTTVLFGGDALYDPASGLYLHGDGTRARDGFRFVQADDLGNGTSNDPITLHKYLYANANPTNGWDPSGHEFELGGLLGVAITGLQLDFGAALTPFSIGRKFGLVHESTPSIFGSQVDSFFNTVSENLAVFGGFAQGFVEGAAQGFFNVVNGIQDAIIGTANLAIKAELATLGPVGLEFNPSIPSPDWSYGLIYNEPPTQHAVSKFLGGIGASLASSGGFGMLGAVGEGGEAGVAAEELSLTQTVAKNAATRPYVNSRLVAQEIMNAKPPIPDPGGIPGGLRWDVEGAFNGSKGVYQLVVNPSTKQIVHFLFTSS